MQTFDLVVIGGGSAGVTAALEAVSQGRHIALVERSGRYGGTCRYVGCVPSKVMLHTAQTLHQMRTHALKLGLPATDLHWEWSNVKQHVNDIIRRIGGKDGYDAPSTFYERGGQTLTGEARFCNPHELAVGDNIVRAQRFIIATGSRPRIPDLAGLQEAGYQTWETIFDLDRVPQTMLIIGGGPLAIEFAQMFCRFGSAVTVIEVADEIIPKADPEAAKTLHNLLEREGVTFKVNAEAQSVRHENEQRIVTIKQGASTIDITVDEILVAVGTQPNSDRLNLEAANVQCNDNGSIKVDEHLRTTASHIWACGDVATKYQFTHIAAYEGKLAAANALNKEQRSVDERVVPWAVYTDPSLAHVGLTEQEAQEQHLAIVSATMSIADVERSLLVEQQDGLIKAIARRADGVLLGVDILSAHADDLIHEAALAIRQQLSVHDIAHTIHAYPTFSEGLQQVMDQLAQKLQES